MSDKMNIYQKLIEVRKSVPYLQKEAMNVGQKFNYTSSSQVLGAIRAKIDELGLVFIPELHDARIVTDAKMSMMLTEARVEYTVINADNPEERITIQWYAQGADQGEKGVGKLVTYAEKYLFLKLFQIPTDKDDPDAFEGKYYDDKPAAPSKPEPRSTPSPTTKNVSRATVDALLEQINAATEVTAHDTDAWREQIMGWPKEYVAEVGAAVKAAKERVK